jgi:membrane protease subunit HflK
VAQDVTQQRLYLETMEEILKNSNKVIIDKSAQGGNGVLPYLPLPALGTGTANVAPPGGTPGNGSAAGGPSSGGAQSPPAAVPPLRRQ